ncbi:hypothetical protein KDA_22410 [Dictyobacter alpinus]|uniref:NodB homology domain-containing protein n=1 Tax=Dictyobacter alpinus TaxID=2014873 RepID=A0A402B5Z9_9CHLR|nr:polysaccharide deacetylase family protein [Dictyobacter alpinus]GCE26757.1 hypothetical protein KDA_22410 [Dictyobacter alpinus]
MKKIILLLAVLIACLAGWGSVIVVYASEAHPVALLATPTVQVTPTVKIINDKLATPAPEVVGQVFSQGNSDKPEIALTFDDGPNPAATQQVLDILKRYHVHATFFCIGENVQSYPALVAQEQADGNIVGNHTWNHPDLTKASVTEVQKQLMDTNSELKSATGTTPTLFRPPYGAIDAAVKQQAAQQHLQPVLWDIDTQDWSMPGTRSIVNAVLDHAGNGDVVLMHDGGGDRTQTIAALPQIIEGLQQKGFNLVTIPQLMNA